MKLRCSRYLQKNLVWIRQSLTVNVLRLRDSSMRLKNKCQRKRLKRCLKRECQDSWRIKKMKKNFLTKQSKTFFRKMQEKSNMWEIKLLLIPRLNLCLRKVIMIFQSMLQTFGSVPLKTLRLLSISFVRKVTLSKTIKFLRSNNS